MNCLKSVIFLIVLISGNATCAVGHCKVCLENEFCDIIIWFFSRCIAFRSEGESCNSFRHQICNPESRCMKGSCRSMFGRSKPPITQLQSTLNEITSSSTAQISMLMTTVATTRPQTLEDSTITTTSLSTFAPTRDQTLEDSTITTTSLSTDKTSRKTTKNGKNPKKT